MKVRIERQCFVKALGHIQRIVQRKNIDIILSHVLLCAKNSLLTLRGLDSGIELVAKVPCSIEQEGTITVAAHMLYDIVRKLQEDEVLLVQESSDSQLVVSSGRSVFHLSCMLSERFPAPLEEQLPESFSLQAELLKRMVEKTQFAISTEETRPYLNGIYLHHVVTDGGGVLRAVATDGFRLAYVDLGSVGFKADWNGMIIPRRTILEVVRILDQESEDVTIRISSSKIEFQFTTGITLLSKLIDGTFPPYEQVIPKENNRILQVDRESFKHAVERVAVVSTERFCPLKLNLDAGRMVLSVEDQYIATAREEIDVVYSDAPLMISFNARYLIEILSSLEHETVLIKLSEKHAPIILKHPDEETFLYILMPILS